MFVAAIEACIQTLRTLLKNREIRMQIRDSSLLQPAFSLPNKPSVVNDTASLLQIFENDNRRKTLRESRMQLLIIAAIVLIFGSPYVEI